MTEKLRVMERMTYNLIVLRRHARRL